MPIAKLIHPLIIEPLLAAWRTVKTVIATGQAKGPRTREYKEARDAYHGFLLCLHLFQVLDPACGSGNFLYLALKALRDLEKQVHQDGLFLSQIRLLRRFFIPTRMEPFMLRYS